MRTHVLPEHRPKPEDPKPDWTSIEELRAEKAMWFQGPYAWPHRLRVLELKYVPFLVYMPALPPTLERLSLGAVGLQSLPALPTGLRELLLINWWNLGALPPLPDGLEQLHLYDPRSLKHLPEFGPALRNVSLGKCRRLELNATQIDRLDALQTRYETGEPGVMLQDFTGPGETLENLRSTELDRAVDRVYEMAGLPCPPAAAEFWEREARAHGAAAEPLCSLLFRMWSDRPSHRGGVRTIARDMEPTLATIVSYPALLPHVIAAAERTPHGCVNQPVLTWRHVAALAAAHEVAFEAGGLLAALHAARPLLAHLAIDQAAAIALGKIRRQRVVEDGADEAAELFAASEPEIANRMAMHVDAQRQDDGEPPLPGIPRAVAYLHDALEAFIDAHWWQAHADVAAIMTAPPNRQDCEPNLIRMLCRGPYADWWKTHLIRHSPAARFDLGVNGQLHATYARELARQELASADTIRGNYVPTAQLKAGQALIEQHREAEAVALEAHTRRELAAPARREPSSARQTKQR